MHQHENLKFVGNQSVWWKGETPFSDLPQHISWREPELAEFPAQP